MISLTEMAPGLPCRRLRATALVVAVLALAGCAGRELQEQKAELARGEFETGCAPTVDCTSISELCVQQHEVVAQACYRSTTPSKAAALAKSRAEWERALTLLPPDASGRRQLTPLWGLASAIAGMRDNATDAAAERAHNAALLQAGSRLEALPGGRRAGAYFQADALSSAVARGWTVGRQACAGVRKTRQLLSTPKPGDEPEGESASLDILVGNLEKVVKVQEQRECNS